MVVLLLWAVYRLLQRTASLSKYCTACQLASRRAVQSAPFFPCTQETVVSSFFLWDLWRTLYASSVLHGFLLVHHAGHHVALLAATPVIVPLSDRLTAFLLQRLLHVTFPHARSLEHVIVRMLCALQAHMQHFMEKIERNNSAKQSRAAMQSIGEVRHESIWHPNAANWQETWMCSCSPSPSPFLHLPLVHFSWQITLYNAQWSQHSHVTRQYGHPGHASMLVPSPQSASAVRSTAPRP